MSTDSRELAPGSSRGLVFARPQDLPEGWYETWDGLVSDMRRESQALPMNTMMTLLVERIATTYVHVRRAEAEGETDWEQLRAMQKLWLNFMTEFGTQLHRHTETPDQRFIAGFKSALTNAMRRAGPDSLVRDLMPILAEEMREYGI